MKKILAASFFSMSADECGIFALGTEDDIRPGETISDREFYTILGMIGAMLAVFGIVVRFF
jgi:hypothetical protein